MLYELNRKFIVAESPPAGSRRVEKIRLRIDYRAASANVSCSHDAGSVLEVGKDLPEAEAKRLCDPPAWPHVHEASPLATPYFGEEKTSV